MSSVIRSLMIKVGADLTDMEKGLNAASKKLKGIGKDFSSAGSSLTKGLTLPIAGAVAGLAAATGKAVSTADELQKMSDVTGISAERLQELKYAGSALGVELETITGAQSKLTKAMFAAKDGTGSQADAFAALGISVTDSKGQLRDAKEVMSEAFTALNGVGNETERDALAMQIFGKSAMELNPLIKAGGEELSRLSDEAQKSGAVMSNESVSALDSFGDSVDAMKLSLQGAAGSAIAEFMPSLEKMMPVVKDKLIPAIGNLIKTISDIIVKFSEMSPGMQKFILAMVGVAFSIGPVFSVVGKLSMGLGALMKSGGAAVKAFKGAKTVFTGIRAAMMAFMGPVGLVIAAVVVLAGLAFLIIKNWDKIKASFIKLWAKVKEIFFAAWEGLKNLFLNYTPQGLIIKHWDTIKQFFINLWARVKEIFTTAWEGIKTSLGSAVTNIKNSVLGVFTSLKNGLKSIWDGIWGTIKGVINSILGGIEAMANGVVKGVNKVIGALNSIKVNIPDWVPLLGGKTFSLNLKPLKGISIPRLADGAVIRPNSEFLAMLGDQKSGVNIETPLSTMIDAFETSLENNGRGGLQIIVTGNKISNEDDANRVADLLVRKLRLSGVKI